MAGLTPGRRLLAQARGPPVAVVGCALLPFPGERPTFLWFSATLAANALSRPSPFGLALLPAVRPGLRGGAKVETRGDGSAWPWPARCWPARRVILPAARLGMPSDARPLIGYRRVCGSPGGAAVTTRLASLVGWVGPLRPAWLYVEWPFLNGHWPTWAAPTVRSSRCLGAGDSQLIAPPDVRPMAFLASAWYPSSPVPPCLAGPCPLCGLWRQRD